MSDNKIDLAMVKSMNEIGRLMDKKTFAEFAENERIFILLNEHNMDYAQRYLIGKLVPLDELKHIKLFIVV
ncbi:MAG: hypothetical protein WAW61_14005 [Methylococcaceae bacterium]